MAPILAGIGTIIATVAVALPSTSFADQGPPAHHPARVLQLAGHDRGGPARASATHRRHHHASARASATHRRHHHASAGASATHRRHHHASAGASAAHRRHHHASARASATHRRHHHASAGASAARGRNRHRATGGSASRHRAAPVGHSDTGGSCPGEGATPAEADLAEIRTATLCLVNRQRTLYGERPLRFNAHLQTSAQQHTESMVSADYFGHYGPNGQTPAQRMRAAGYIHGAGIGYSVGENIAWGSLYLATPKSIVAAWMRSPEHRANILDAEYRETAIGVLAQLPESVAEGEPGAIYTQDFGVLIHG